MSRKGKPPWPGSSCWSWGCVSTRPPRGAPGSPSSITFGFLLFASSPRIKRTVRLDPGSSRGCSCWSGGGYTIPSYSSCRRVSTRTPASAVPTSTGTRLWMSRKDALSRDLLRTLFGYGPETFFYLNLKREFLGMEYTFLSCDSSWIQSAIETGVLGVSMAILLGGIFSIRCTTSGTCPAN